MSVHPHQVLMLEGAKIRTVKDDKNGEDFTIGQASGALAFSSAID